MVPSASLLSIFSSKFKEIMETEKLGISSKKAAEYLIDGEKSKNGILL